MDYSFRGIHHVQIAAPQDSDVESRNFYGVALQMEEIEKPENLKKRGGVWFACGNHQLHIGIQDDFVSAKKAHPAFEMVNLDALRKRLTEYRVVIVDDVAIEGMKRLFVNDPFGNRLEFLERI